MEKRKRPKKSRSSSRGPLSSEKCPNFGTPGNSKLGWTNCEFLCTSHRVPKLGCTARELRMCTPHGVHMAFVSPFGAVVLWDGGCPECFGTHTDSTVPPPPKAHFPSNPQMPSNPQRRPWGVKGGVRGMGKGMRHRVVGVVIRRGLGEGILRGRGMAKGNGIPRCHSSRRQSVPPRRVGK